MSTPSQETSDGKVFSHQIQEVVKAFTISKERGEVVGASIDTNRAIRSVKRKKPDEVEVPVFHTFLIKEIRDSEAGPQLIGTFVQWVFGIPSSDPDKKPYFHYRFNESSAALRGLVDRRKTEEHTIRISERSVRAQPSTADEGKGEEKAEEEKMSDEEEEKQTPPKESALPNEEIIEADVCRHTFQIEAPMKLVVEFDSFPFTVTRAMVDVEMSSCEDKNGRNLRLRPSFLLHNDDRRNNVCIQELKNTCRTGQTQTDPNQEHDLRLKLDFLDEYSMVSPYPEITYHYDNKKEYCPRFSVSFWLVEEGMPKFIRIVLPMLLICCMNTWNVFTAFKGRDDPNENSTEEKAADGQYLGNAAVLALTAVFLLPEIAPCRNHRNTLSLRNDAYILLVFIALGLSSIPPGLGGSAFPLTGFIGIGFFWISFFPIAINWRSYKRCIRKIEQQRRNVKGKKGDKGDEHPFLKDDSYEEWWKAHNDTVTTSDAYTTKTVDEDCTFVGGIVEKAKKEVEKAKEEVEKAKEEKRKNNGSDAPDPEPGRGECIWEEGEEVSVNEYTVSKSGDTFFVYY